jgi:hypothetical protein
LYRYDVVVTPKVRTAQATNTATTIAIAADEEHKQFPGIPSANRRLAFACEIPM